MRWDREFAWRLLHLAPDRRTEFLRKCCCDVEDAMGLLLKMQKETGAAEGGKRPSVASAGGWRRRNYRKFIVLGTHRTGSNLLLSLLNSHPNVVVQGEIFLRLEGNCYEEVLDDTFGRYAPEVHNVGFKLFYKHPFDDATDGLWKMLGNIRELRVIHLKRRNLLRLALSEKIARKLDWWFVHGSPLARIHKVREKQVRFDVDELTSFFETVERESEERERYFEESPRLSLHYEDLTSRREETYGKILDFLALPGHLPGTYMRRQNPEGCRQLIVNFGELRRHFRKTRWAGFFEEDSRGEMG